MDTARAERRDKRRSLVLTAVIFVPPMLCALGMSLSAMFRVIQANHELAKLGAPESGVPLLPLLLGSMVPTAVVLGLIAATVGRWFWLRERPARAASPAEYGRQPHDAVRDTPVRGVRNQLANVGLTGERLAKAVLIGGPALGLLIAITAAMTTQLGASALGETLPMQETWVAFGKAGILLVVVAVIVWRTPQSTLGRRARLEANACSMAPPPYAFHALEAAAVAGAVRQPTLRVVEASSVNAFIVDADDAPRPVIFVTRGMLEALTEQQLIVIFANLLYRLIAGVAREATLAVGEEAVIGPPDLIEIHRTADAQSLLWLKDPEQILGAMNAVKARDNRVDAGEPVSPSCFYTWPNSRPPFDLEDRMRVMVTLAGTAGHIWWELERAKKLEAAVQRID